MAKHKEWRKLAKKLRRKRIRQQKAKLRDEKALQEQRLREQNPAYQAWLEHKQKEEALRAVQEARISDENERQWRKNEEEAQKKFREYQERQRVAREEREKQNEKIRKEWEQEQQKLKEKKEREHIEKEKEQERLEKLNEKVEWFLENGGDTPEHLKLTMETNPSKETCTFFQKTGACRFGDACSRNHVRPGISRVLLIPNFFSHYSLEKTEFEHILDSDLEHENHETYQAFREFFHDVVDELETYGRLKLFKVCCNKEHHLRGNVYVEFATTRAALKCYKGIHGRWYGGKQLTAEFCGITAWKRAICGLYFTKKCPKGSMCNYLHVFKNPKNLFSNYEDHTRIDRDRESKDGSQRNWRWSESPERTPHIDGWDSDDHYNNHRRERNRSERGSSRRNNDHKHSERRSRRSSSERETPVRRARKRSSERKQRHRSRDKSDRSSRSKRRKRSRSRSS
ncbi:unnamed protein product [Callosobruchus maculatus]|uniref:Uncharacterized protein n=2 Tax=Callosobruchus maculatus TaxID=64391 RepID=A0A653DL93_CALMS|nr:unnamed protein product [Callosobruchus maculatus]